METPLETERPSPRYSGIDLWSPAEILDSMIEGQFAAVAAVHAARPALERAALTIEERLRAGGRLVYAGAGTSGRLAVQDGAELMPTFSWPAERLLLLMAGGDDALLRAVEGAEDTADEAAALIYQHRIGDKDALIAVTASGTTPFTLACLREAGARGALQSGARGMHRGDGGELPLDHRIEDIRRAPLVDAGIAGARAFSFQRISPCAPSLINARDPFLVLGRSTS